MSGISKQNIKASTEDGVILIDIFIEKLEDIYAPSNYTTSRDKALNNELEKYLFNSLSNYKLKAKIKILIHLPANSAAMDISQIRTIFHNHFIYKVRETELYLKKKFRQWRLNLFIGIVFLSTCFILLELFSSEATINIIKMFRESLLIMGWVALWEPITFILFGWHPILKNKLYYKKLTEIPIGIQRYVRKAAGYKYMV